MMVYSHRIYDTLNEAEIVKGLIKTIEEYEPNVTNI
jgi:hypothetical protein